MEATSVPVNYLAVFGAGVISMVIGFIWYSPLIVGKAWMKEKGYSADSLKKAQKDMEKLYGLSFVLSLLTAYVLSHMVFLSDNFYQFGRLPTGLITAFWMWLGFIMPVQLTAAIFGDKNWKLFAIDTGYQLASVVSMGTVVGLT